MALPKPKPQPNPFGYKPPTSQVGRTSVATGSGNVETDLLNAIVDTQGLLPFAFYSATNASGQMLRPGTAAAIGVTMPFRGSIVAMASMASAADTGTYAAYIDGVAQTAASALAAETSDYQLFQSDLYQFAEGQVISVTASSVSSANPVEVIVYVALDPSTVL